LIYATWKEGSPARFGHGEEEKRAAMQTGSKEEDDL